MSALDVLRSFAEAQEHDAIVLRDGITYGDLRALLKLIAALRDERDAALARANEWEAILRDYRGSYTLARDEAEQMKAERDEAIRRAETEARCAARYRWLFRHDDSPVSRVNRVWRAWDGCDGYYGWNRAIAAARAEPPR